MRNRFSQLLGLSVITTIFLILILDPFGIILPGVFAQETVKKVTTVTSTYTQLLNTLTKVFIIAVLVEVALSIVFRWRIFLRYLNDKGWKVPISFFVSLIIVTTHKIDLPGEVVYAMDGLSGPIPPTGIGQIISALIIAGGSASVNSVFQRLGWRNPLEQNQIAQEERYRTGTLLRINVDRKNDGETKGRNLTVKLDGTVIGMISDTEHEFGGSEGYMIKSGKHTVEIVWVNRSGHERHESKSITIAKGANAIVDFSLP